MSACDLIVSFVFLLVEVWLTNLVYNYFWQIAEESNLIELFNTDTNELLYTKERQKICILFAWFVYEFGFLGWGLWSGVLLCVCIVLNDFEGHRLLVLCSYHFYDWICVFDSKIS